MKLTAEKIQMNWVEFMSNIDTYISSPRKEQLKAFYEKFEDRISLMPASHKKEYHSAFPGGYVDHVNRVVKAAFYYRFKIYSRKRFRSSKKWVKYPTY
jgi:hypothetical protein